MKKFIGLMVAVAFTLNIQAQKFAKLDASILDVSYFPAKASFAAFEKTEEAKKALTPKMRVIYSRPLKKEREVFGKLVEYGKVWRLGANENTEIEFFVPVTIDGKTIAPGKYSVFANVTDKEWVVIFNKDVHTWGSYAYNAKNDVAKVTVPAKKVNAVQEAFSITFYQPDGQSGVAHMKMGWDNIVAEVPIKL